MTPETIYVVSVFSVGIAMLALLCWCIHKESQREGELIYRRDSERRKWNEYKMLCRGGASAGQRRVHLTNIVLEK